MKSMHFWLLLLLVLMLPETMVVAQGVYMTPGAHGPVFSDKPQPGAREVNLPPLNVVAPVQSPESALSPLPPPPGAIPAQGGRPGANAASVAYRSFVVLSPENEGSVIANSASFEVRVTAEPPLQLGDGHAFAISIDGRPVGRRFTSSEFMIPPEFFGYTPPMNQSAQLDASIVDGSGRVLMRAPSVRFFMRFTTILNRPGYALPPLVAPPRPRPRPTPDAAPAPAPAEPASGSIGASGKASRSSSGQMFSR